MDQKWKDIMNCLLGVVLYHGRLPEESSWCEQYNCEVRSMVKDIKAYHQSNTEAGLVFFVKHFSLKKASEFPVFSKGFSLL